MLLAFTELGLSTSLTYDKSGSTTTRLGQRQPEVKNAASQKISDVHRGDTRLVLRTPYTARSPDPVLSMLKDTNSQSLSLILACLALQGRFRDKSHSSECWQRVGTREQCMIAHVGSYPSVEASENESASSFHPFMNTNLFAFVHSCLPPRIFSMLSLSNIH